MSETPATSATTVLPDEHDGPSFSSASPPDTPDTAGAPDTFLFLQKPRSSTLRITAAAVPTRLVYSITDAHPPTAREPSLVVSLGTSSEKNDNNHHVIHHHRARQASRQHYPLAYFFQDSFGDYTVGVDHTGVGLEHAMRWVEVCERRGWRGWRSGAGMTGAEAAFEWEGRRFGIRRYRRVGAAETEAKAAMKARAKAEARSRRESRREEKRQAKAAASAAAASSSKSKSKAPSIASPRPNPSQVPSPSPTPSVSTSASTDSTQPPPSDPYHYQIIERDGDGQNHVVASYAAAAVVSPPSPPPPSAADRDQPQPQPQPQAQNGDQDQAQEQGGRQRPGQPMPVCRGTLTIQPGIVAAEPELTVLLVTAIAGWRELDRRRRRGFA